MVICSLLLSLLLASPVLAALNARPPYKHAVETPIDAAWYSATHTFATTRYIMQNEPGASDSNNCATQYYVSGTNGPCLTFGAAAITALSGTGGWRIYVGSGTYTPTGSPAGVTFNCTGSANAPCMIAGVPAQWPIIKGSSVSGDLPLSPGPVGWWKFNESAGTATTAADSSGNSQPATIVASPVFSENGAVGNYLLLNGTTQYGSVADSATLSLTGDLSMTAWVNRNTQTGWRAIFCKQANVDHTPPYCNYGMLQFSGSTEWTMYINGIGVQFGSTALAAGTWLHLACTFAAATNTGLCYQNGVAALNSTAFTSDPLNSTYPLLLGRTMDASQFWAGGLDDLRVYNRVLSPSEVAQLAAGTQTSVPDAVVRLQGTYIILDSMVIEAGGVPAAVLVQSDDTLVRRMVLRTSNYGIQVAANADRGLAYGNRIDGSTVAAIDVQSGDDWIVRSNYIQGCTKHGIRLYGGVDDGSVAYNAINCPDGIGTAVRLGGGTAAEDTSAETGTAHCTDCVAYGNEVLNYAGNAGGVLGCVNCELSYNRFLTAACGMVVEAGGSTGNPGTSSSALLASNVVNNADFGCLLRWKNSSSSNLASVRIYASRILGQYLDPPVATVAATVTNATVDTACPVLPSGRWYLITRAVSTGGLESSSSNAITLYSLGSTVHIFDSLTAELTATENLYGVGTSDDIFAVDGTAYTFSDWQTVTGEDADSALLE